MNRKAMNKMTRIGLVFLFECIGAIGFAQSNLIIEQIQTYSAVNPTGIYWRLPSNIDPILEAMDNGLFASLNLQRDKQYTPITKILTKDSQMGKITVGGLNDTNTPYHAYLELYEVAPSFAYNNNLLNLPETKKDSVHSIWIIACTILNQKQSPIFQKSILLGILPIQSLGFGYPISTSSSTPNNIYQAVTKGISMLSKNTEELDYIEAKLPMAYATDNYWMPLIHNQPRILLDTTKSFISYNTVTGSHLMRVPPAVLNKINIKDKSLNNPFKEVIVYIKKNRTGSGINEYYQVTQSLRDVKNNIDYTIQGFIEFKNTTLFSNEATTNAISFLPDSMHTIYQGKDSIGNFSVKENVVEKDKYFNPNEIFNGYDSTKKFTVLSGKPLPMQPIIHSRVVEGKLKNHVFSIQINFNSNLKTILLDGKIIMIIEGEKNPSMMITTSTQKDESITNLLLLIASSEIFQYPS